MPSLGPCTSQGWHSLASTSSAWGSLQGAWDLILAAVVEPFHLFFWGGAHGCHLSLQALSAWEEIHGLSVFPLCCLSFPR